MLRTRLPQALLVLRQMLWLRGAYLQGELPLSLSCSCLRFPALSSSCFAAVLAPDATSGGTNGLTPLLQAMAAPIPAQVTAPTRVMDVLPAERREAQELRAHAAVSARTLTMAWNTGFVRQLPRRNLIL